MDKKDPDYFLNQNSLLELEKSKGAECIIYIPRMIKSYEDAIAMHRSKIDMLEEKKVAYNRELLELKKIKGLKLLLRISEVSKKKKQLNRSITECDKSIETILNNIKLIEGLIKEQKNILNGIKSEIYAAGLTLEEVEREYDKLHKELLKGKLLPTLQPSASEKIEDDSKLESDKTKRTRTTQIDKFYRRQQKHLEKIANDGNNQEKIN